MSEHVPLARPATVSADSMVWPWTFVFFGAVLAATYASLSDRPDAPVAVVAVQVVILAWFLLVARPVLGCPRLTVRAWVAWVGLMIGFVVALVLTPAAGYLMIGLPGVTFLLLDDHRAAYSALALACALPTAVFLATGNAVDQALQVTLPVGVGSFLFSVVLASLVIRISNRSRERALLIDELEASRAEVARLSLAAGVAQERQRLAGEIHDTVAQGLSSVVMLVQAADAALATEPERAREHLALAARTARENLDETRALVAALAPPPLVDATLPEALRRLGSASVSVSVLGEVRPLDRACEVVLLRAAQESLTNARKHSTATMSSVCLAFEPSTVVLTVTDNGAGFDPAAPTEGFGLRTMRGRVGSISGTVDIHSGTTGTSVRVEVPA